MLVTKIFEQLWLRYYVVNDGTHEVDRWKKRTVQAKLDHYLERSSSEPLQTMCMAIVCIEQKSDFASILLI